MCAAAFEKDVEELDGIDSDGPELELGGSVQQPWEVSAVDKNLAAAVDPRRRFAKVEIGAQGVLCQHNRADTQVSGVPVSKDHLEGGDAGNAGDADPAGLAGTADASLSVLDLVVVRQAELHRPLSVDFVEQIPLGEGDTLELLRVTAKQSPAVGHSPVAGHLGSLVVLARPMESLLCSPWVATSSVAALFLAFNLVPKLPDSYLLWLAFIDRIPGRI